MLFRIGAAPFGGGLTYPIAVFKKVTARSQNHGRSLEGGPFDEIGSVRSRFMCLSSLTSCLFLAHADTGERDRDLLRLREWPFTSTALARLGSR